MRWLVPALAALALAAPAHSHTWYITPDGTGDAPDLQAALQVAADGDEIVLSDGVFSGPGNRDVSFLGKAVVLRSLSGNAEACIVDCGGSPGDPHRGFLFVSGEGPGTALERLTIRNGYVVGSGTADELVERVG